VRGTVREQLHESSIGPIPRGWKVERLKDVCERVSVGIASAATHAYAKEGIPLIRNQNIKEGFLDTADLLFITPEFDGKYACKRLKEGDVLTVRTGYPGVSAVVPKQYESCQSFTTLISRPIKERLNPQFLCHWINSAHGKAFVAVGKMGAAQQNLNAGILEDMELPIPPLNEQDVICEAISGATESRKEIESLLNELHKLYSRLLCRLIDC
jgi:type I restriction enzyme S subunit